MVMVQEWNFTWPLLSPGAMEVAFFIQLFSIQDLLHLTKKPWNLETMGF